MPLSETVLVLMALLATGMLAAGTFRKLPVPDSVLLVVIGIVLNWASTAWAPLASLAHFRLTPELVLFIFLPALIFESGLNLDARQLIKDLAPVLTLAVPALLISTAAVGVGLWLLLPIDLTLALVFGALISATDPVAVVALFKELGTPQRLTVLVEGESLLNDATAIVVFNILLGIAVFGGITWADAGLAAGQFIKVFLGGALGGVVTGMVTSWLMTRLQVGTAGILILSVVMAYTSFVVAEHTLHLSGVMAVAASAVTLGVIGVPRLTQETGVVLRETWEFLALVCNTLLFILVGLSVDLAGLASHLGAILTAVVLVQAVRAGLIYTLVPTATRVFRLPRITMGERHIMSWGGLKGGLAIAIVLSIPEDLPGRQILLDLTLGVVTFTLLVNAPTVRPLIRWLGIDRLTDDERAEVGRGVQLARGQADSFLYRLRNAGVLSRASHHQVRQSLTAALPENPDDVAHEHRLRGHRLDTLRLELTSLEELYQAGVIPQYTFLDLKGELQRKRDHLVAGKDRFAAGPSRQQNPFLRLEDALVRRLREHDWAAPLLARYQSLRTSQHLIRDIAHMLMAEAVLDHLHSSKHLEPEDRDSLQAFYRERLRQFRDNLAQTRRDFPEFYAGFERRLALRAAIARALRGTDDEHRHGGIGAKAFTLIERRMHQALADLPPISEPLPQLRARDFVAMVPLLSGLSVAALDDIAGKAQALTFLAGDTVIGQGEHGDALYVVAKGRLSVSRATGPEEVALAELAEGDFFGETALLGDQVRTANVRALQACTLLRLTRKDVLGLADRHPEIGERLETARQERVTTNETQA